MSSPFPRTALLPLLLAAAAAPGCGGDGADRAADRTAVMATVQRLYDAMVGRDGKRVCKELSRAARRQVTGGSRAACERVFTRFWASFANAVARRPRILRVELDGDRATAVVTFGDAGRARLPLTRSEDGWKLDRASMSPLMWGRDLDRGPGRPPAVFPV